MIQLKKLTVRAGEFMLREIDMQIEEGTCHALLGPSGSGKSTLVQAILGLKTPESGAVLLRGLDVTQLPTHRRGFGYLPQHLALFPHLNVEENLRYGIKAQRLPAVDTEPLLQELIEVTGIGRLLDRMSATLSGGERQRVALVRALAPRPKMLLLDEPFSALDAGLKRNLWMLAKKLQQEYGTTMLLITHDLEEAGFLASRISVIIDGEIRQSGTWEELWARPRNEAVARYMGIRNIFDAVVTGQNEERLSVRVEALGSDLKLVTSGRHLPGEKLTLAIRAEDLRASAEGCDNVLKGRIEWMKMGSRSLGIFTPEKGVQKVEFMAGHEAVDTGEERMTLCLPAEKIITLAQPSSQ